MIGTMGWQQLLLILLILALLFGARRISDLGGALGRGIREFKSEVRENAEEPVEEQKPQATTSSATTEAEEREQPRT
jgi:sec-independent protein translocase protein TatA